MKLLVTDREFATILAAVRYWQEQVTGNACEEDSYGEYLDFFDDHEPLTAGEIDELCERVNVADDTPLGPQTYQLAEHVQAMADDSYFTGHPEWQTIVAQAKAILAQPATKDWERMAALLLEACLAIAPLADSWVNGQGNEPMADWDAALLLVQQAIVEASK